MRRIVAIMLCGAALGFLASARALAAQDDETVAPNEDPQLDAGPRRGFNGIDIRQNFDRWLFVGGQGESGRDHLASQIKTQLDAIDHACKLTGAQRHKLLRAAALDTQQYYFEVDALRQKAFATAVKDPEDFNQIWQEIQPLRNRILAGLYGEKSFFAKVRRQTLVGEQATRYQALIDQRRRLRHQANVAMALLELDDRLGLTDSQHAALTEMLKEPTKLSGLMGHYEVSLVLAQLTRVPEDRLKPLFDERQWKKLSDSLNEQRDLEKALEQQGLAGEASEGDD